MGKVEWTSSISLAPIITEIKRRTNQLGGTSTAVTRSRTELDSHADTCTIGRNVLVTHIHERKVNVSPYDPALGSVKDLDVVNAAVAYDCPATGDVVIFNINQAIHINTMSNNLLCVIQVRMNNINVFECIKFLIDNPTFTNHTLVIPPSDNDGEETIVPLSLHGVTSYVDTRNQTIQEYELAEKEGRSYDLTYDSPEWQPHSDTFKDQELVAHGRLDMEDRGLCSFDTNHIWDESDLGVPWN